MSPNDRVAKAITAIVAPDTKTMPRVPPAQLSYMLVSAGLRAASKQPSQASFEELTRSEPMNRLESLCGVLQTRLNDHSVAELTRKLADAVREWQSGVVCEEDVSLLVSTLVEKHIDSFVMAATEIALELSASNFVEDCEEGEESDDASSASADTDDIESEDDEEDEEDGEEDDEEGEEEDYEDGEEGEEGEEGEDEVEDEPSKRSRDSDDDAEGLMSSKRCRP
jgi:cobalamin biosynthesis protein CobT